MASSAEKSFTSETSVITCDMNGIVQQYAADAEALFGWKRDAVIGKMSVAMFHVPKNVPTLVPRLLREAVEKGKFEEEVTLMRKDAATFRAILTVRPIFREDKQVGFMGMTKPLTPPGEVPVAKLWIQALRAPFLIASIIPVLVAGFAAWQTRGVFDAITPLSAVGNTHTFIVSSTTVGVSTLTARVFDQGNLALQQTPTVNFVCLNGAGSALSFTAQDVQFAYANPQNPPPPLTHVLSSLTVTWDDQSDTRLLVSVKMGATVIWSNAGVTSPFTIDADDWIIGANRSIAPGASKSLVLTFNVSALGGTYTLNPVDWDDGAGGNVCTSAPVSVTR